MYQSSCNGKYCERYKFIFKKYSTFNQNILFLIFIDRDRSLETNTELNTLFRIHSHVKQIISNLQNEESHYLYVSCILFVNVHQTALKDQAYNLRSATLLFGKQSSNKHLESGTDY